jgi:hypothetical protein
MVVFLHRAQPAGAGNCWRGGCGLSTALPAASHASPAGAAMHLPVVVMVVHCGQAHPICCLLGSNWPSRVAFQRAGGQQSAWPEWLPNQPGLLAGKTPGELASRSHHNHVAAYLREVAGGRRQPPSRQEVAVLTRSKGVSLAPLAACLHAGNVRWGPVCWGRGRVVWCGWGAGLRQGGCASYLRCPCAGQRGRLHACATDPAPAFSLDSAWTNCTNLTRRGAAGVECKAAPAYDVHTQLHPYFNAHALQGRRRGATVATKRIALAHVFCCACSSLQEGPSLSKEELSKAVQEAASRGWEGWGTQGTEPKRTVKVFRWLAVITQVTCLLAHICFVLLLMLVQEVPFF